MITLNGNNSTYTIDVDPSTPRLWVLRDILGLVGKKYGCVIGQCGCRTVDVVSATVVASSKGNAVY